MRKNLFLSLLVLVPLYLTLLSNQGFTQEPLLVKKIRIEGLHRYTEFQIRSRMRLKEGDIFNEDTLKSDIKRLFETGFFESIQPETQSTSEGVVVVLHVQEKETVARIKFQFNDYFKDKKLKSEIGLRAGEVYNPLVVKQDVEAIEELYRKEGFPLVEVKVEAAPSPAGLVVTYQVIEGTRIKVDHIRFHGNVSLPGKKIRHVMQTQETSWLTNHYFIRSVFLDDLERIKALYRTEGLLDVIVTHQLRFSPQGDTVSVDIFIEENKPYYIASVGILGNQVFPKARLQALTKLKPGQRYDEQRIQRDVSAIRHAYADKGYADVDVQYQTFQTRKPYFLTLTYQITEGVPYTIGMINIYGNIKTKDKVIRRELVFYPGDLYSLSKMEKSEKNLQDLGYFKSATIKPSETLYKNVKDVDVEVRETSTGNVRFGVGYGTTTGITGLVELTQRNFDATRWPKSFSDLIEGKAFAGGGQLLRLSLVPSARQFLFDSLFREPYLFDKPLGWEIGISRFLRDYGFYKEGDFNAETSLTYRFQNQWFLGSSVEYENVHIGGVDENTPVEIRDVKGTNAIASLTPFVGKDTRDSTLLPSSGYRLQLSNQIGGLLGGRFHFIKPLLTFEKYITLHESETEAKQILSVKSSVGIIHETSGRLPFFEKFFLGGPTTLRGFEYRTISPKEGNKEVGGDRFFYTQLEYSLPLYRIQQGLWYRDIIRGIAFLDTGTSIDHSIFSDVRVSTGVGVQVTIPQLGNAPFGLDIGFPLRRDRTDRTQIIQFTFGGF